ncbi:ArsR family transcriptional regulator [Sphingobium sp. AN641]|uniref:ArsR family transcriptional regulator n=1 Tax=Sphingobium sp. AN641 TaxID=3133443 RepID=UPI0030C15332
MTAHIPPDRELPSQDAVDLVIALQRCLSSFHGQRAETAILDAGDDDRLVMLNRYIKARRTRYTLFGQGLFSDPAWDILLLLYRAERDEQPMSLDQLTEVSHISMTIILRHVGVMERRGLLLGASGSQGGGGRRRVRLSPLAMDAMTAWLHLAFEAEPQKGGQPNGF